MNILAERGWRCNICGKLVSDIQYHLANEHNIPFACQIWDTSGGYVLNGRDLYGFFARAEATTRVREIDN